MSKKVKVAYDWYGPNGPLINNYAPNLLQLASGLPTVKISDWRNYFTPHAAQMVLATIDGYEFAPSWAIKDSDTFVYEYTMNWRQPLDHFFYPEHGVIEQSYLSDRLKNLIRYGNGYLLFEYCAEAFVTGDVFDRMHNYFDYHNIPTNKIIYMTGCANCTDLYTVYCNNKGIPVEKRMSVIFFEWIEWNVSRRLRDKGAPSCPITPNFDSIEKDFIVFNRRYRDHRHNLTLLFYKYGLIEKSFYSLPDYDPDYRSAMWKTRVNRGFVDTLGLTDQDIDNIQSMLPLKFDTITDQNDMVQDGGNKLSEWYQKSLVSVVTETNYYNDEISITEKTYKPIRYKHPFIMVGGYLSLAHLRKYGYKTFGKWWDESYDEIPDHHSRLQAIGNVCATISGWSREQKQQFFEESQEIVDHNWNKLASSYPINYSCQFWTNFRDLAV
jgi:hypothetical protein